MANLRVSPADDLRHQRDLLRLEYEQEKASYRSQAERMDIRRRIERGICWYPIDLGRDYYNSLNQLVIEIERIGDRDIEHNFEYGKPVCFFSADMGGRTTFLDFAATVGYVREEGRMVVALPHRAALDQLLAKAGNLGIQLYFDERSYRLMFEALDAVSQAKGNRLAHLRDTLLGALTPGNRDLFPVRFPWLNPSQEEAVNRVLASREVAIVHGPPGTGKTTTLVEAIYETLHRENQALVCAQSNTAVDWIAEKLVDRGIHVLRVGNPTRVNDKMLSFTYERRFEAHPNYPELWSVRKTIREVRASLGKRGGSERETLCDRLSRLRQREAELEISIDSSLFAEARVVACTLVGSASHVLTEHHFTTLFIDEAAQALEAACWIAIAKSERVILAGDHYQLPPTIKCVEAERGGLGQTLLQKIALAKPETVSLLKIQYRMHEDIMRFSSQWFYNNELKAAPEVGHRGILRLDTPIVWLDTEGLDFTEGTQGESMSRLNRQEAILLVDRLHAYVEKITLDRVLDEHIDFGLISPYKAQVRLIRSLIREDTYLHPIRRQIAVHTVDGFQGQERDVIFISLVRANEERRIGFLSDIRRMNVAITRARMKLFIIGSSATLSRNKFYHSLYDYIYGVGRVEIVQQSSLSEGISPSAE